jgi:hypothetical protein
MSAGTPVQVTFAADVAQIQRAYADFQRYVAANPVPLVPGGPNLTAQQLQAPFQQAMGAAARNAAKEFIGEIGNQSGRGGGGGAGGFGGFGSGFGRYLTYGFLAREALRLTNDVARASVAEAGATSSFSRYQASRTGMQHIFGIPLVGQALELASFPARYGAEITAQQAERQEQANSVRAQSLQFQRDLYGRAAVAAAGPPGSYESRKQEIEDERRRGEQRIIAEVGKRREEALKELEGRRSEAGTSASNARGWTVLAGAATAGISGLFPNAFGSTSSEGGEAAANRNYDTTRRALEAETASQKKRNDEIAKRNLLELEYQRSQQVRQARAGADEARLEYEHRPQVAEARGEYERYEREAEAFRHSGNAPAATAVLQEATYRLMHRREQLMLGGSATETESPDTVDLSGTNQTFMGRGRGQYDDTSEAIQELTRLVGQIAAETAKIRGNTD